MKVKIAFDWDKMAQKELGVEIDIPLGEVYNIVINHFMHLGNE